jgi:hypothetical protein
MEPWIAGLAGGAAEAVAHPAEAAQAMAATKTPSARMDLEVGEQISIAKDPLRMRRG